MTVLTSANKAVIAGNGVATAFGFSFNAGYAQNAPSAALALSYLSVLVTDALGNLTTIAQGSGANQCQITLNPPVGSALWGLGGSVAYNPLGVPLPAGSTLTVLRTIPLTQIVALSNQGGLFPQTVEMAMDLLEFQIQQLAAQYGQAFVAAVSDPPPAPLPPAAQRANKGAAFDAFGNLVAGALPATGVISSAMQPVVNAASLAAGRFALGLGTMAAEGIGAGLADDGAGNARVLAPLLPVAANQAVHAANHTDIYAATGALVFTLDRANTLFSGFTVTVYALTAAITLIPNAADNFFGLASGAALSIPLGSVAVLTTDGATSGLWIIDVSGRPASAVLDASPANPVATASSTPVMMGIGKDQAGSGAHPCTITPAISTRVFLLIYFTSLENTNASGVIAQAAYGTGTAPSNGVSATGTTVGTPQEAALTAGTGVQVPMTVGGIITGLTIGTAYWFDLQMKQAGSGLASATNVHCIAHEIV